MSTRMLVFAFLILTFASLSESTARFFQTKYEESSVQMKVSDGRLRQFVSEMVQVRERRLVYPSSDLQVGNSSICSCQNYTCGCCLHLEVKKISLNDTGCVNISYLPDEYGVQIALVLDGKIIIKEEVSAKNPPPICVGIPYIHDLASLCVRLYDLDIKGDRFSGCIMIEAKLEGVTIESFKLGCFVVPP